MPAGRPTDYKIKYVQEAFERAQHGATDMELADSFGVSVRTIYKWKNDHPEFSQALKLGKEHADERVIRSLYQRATGFEHDALKVFLDKEGDPVLVPYREFVVPDTTACIFWLKNRRKEDWRDKIEQEHSGEVGLNFVSKSILESKD